MSTLALVRSAQDLVCARSELSDFFSLRRQRDPVLSPETLLGIWLDPDMAAENLKAEEEAHTRSILDEVRSPHAEIRELKTPLPQAIAPRRPHQHAATE